MGDGINVHTDQLDDFSTKVSKSATDDLEYGYYSTEYQLSAGPTFGYKTQSQAVIAAKQLVADSTKQATANMQNYIDAAQILSDAAKDIAASLKDTDDRAAASLQATQKAQNAIYAAQQALLKQQQVDAAKAAAQQQQRETGRAE